MISSLDIPINGSLYFPEVANQQDMVMLLEAITALHIHLSERVGATIFDPSEYTAVANPTNITVGNLVKIQCKATDAVVAGDFVSFYDNAGEFSCKWASDDLIYTPGYRAHGYVVEVDASGIVLVQTSGINPHLTGLTVGQTYFLDTLNPGKVTTSGSRALGVAVSTTHLLVN